jgi:hypothetical protein
MMWAFAIRLIEIDDAQAFKLSAWARPRCKEFQIHKEPYRTIFSGALRSPVETRKFVKCMRANMTNWGIDHVPNQRWIDVITLQDYIENHNGFFQERMDEQKHAQDVIDALILKNLEIKAAVKMQKLKVIEECERSIKTKDRVTTRLVFNVFAETVKKRKVAEKEVRDRNNELKRERFREELDLLGICTSLPHDCTPYEDLADITQLRDLVVYKRYRT